jgi:hypothetical protein
MNPHSSKLVGKHGAVDRAGSGRGQTPALVDDDRDPSIARNTYTRPWRAYGRRTTSYNDNSVDLSRLAIRQSPTAKQLLPQIPSN